MKLVETLTHEQSPYTVRIYHNTEWEEYVAKLYDGNKCSPAKTWYHTGDRVDCICTGRFILRDAIYQSTPLK